MSRLKIFGLRLSALLRVGEAIRNDNAPTELSEGSHRMLFPIIRYQDNVNMESVADIDTAPFNKKLG